MRGEETIAEVGKEIKTKERGESELVTALHTSYHDESSAEDTTSTSRGPS